MNNKKTINDLSSLQSSSSDDNLKPNNPANDAGPLTEDSLVPLFKVYDPDLSSDRLFMAALNKRLKDVELVKSRIESMHKQNRRAVFMAGLAGVLCGIVLTLLYPMLLGFVAQLSSMVASTIPDIALYNNTILLIILTAVTIYITLSTYRLMLRQG